MKRIIMLFLLLATILGCGNEFNENFMVQFDSGLTSANNLTDSISFISKQIQLFEKQPYKKKLSDEVKDTIKFIYHKVLLKKQERADWLRAVEMNTIDGYLDFIKKYPKSGYLGKARHALKKISNSNSTVPVVPTKPQHPSVKYHSSSLKFIKLICVKKKDVTATDEIYLKIDGKLVLKNKKMTDGDIVNLNKVKELSLSNSSFHTITVQEEDPLAFQTLLSMTFDGNNYKPGKHEKKFDWQGLKGDYILIYMIK